MKDRFVEGDLMTMARGRTKWQNSIRKARKYMANEKFLEKATGLQWRITPLGRKAAVDKAKTE
jgi:hypothetical protein